MTVVLSKHDLSHEIRLRLIKYTQSCKGFQFSGLLTRCSGINRNP